MSVILLLIFNYDLLTYLKSIYIFINLCVNIDFGKII